MRSNLLCICACAALAIAAPACSSSSNSGQTTTDGGSDAHAAQDSGVSTEASSGQDGATDDAAPDAPAEAATVCNTVMDSAPAVTIQQVAQDPPTPKGGTPADGTYFMTDVTIYTGAGGPTGASGSAQTTIQISGSTIQVSSSGEPPTRTATLVTSNTSFTSTDTCPDSAVSTGSYSASATTFAVQLPGGTDDAGARTVVETFTKQ